MKHSQQCALVLLAWLLSSVFFSGCAGDCDPKGRYLVITTFAGMANRLRILASAKIMAALTDRQLVVDWPVKSDELPGKWTDFFINPLIVFENSSLEKEGCSLSTIKNAQAGDAKIKNLGTQNDAEAQKRLAQITEDKEAIVYFGTSLPFQPDEKYLSGQEYRERRQLFYKSLDPTTLVQKAIKDFKKTHRFDDYFMIGVHYRGWQTGRPDTQSNLIADPTNRYIGDFISEMKKAKAATLADTDGKPVAFFLASDNQDAREKIQAAPELAGAVFTREEEVDRTTIRGQESALVDFFLLGATNYIIGTAQSSFSDEAAHLTKQDKKIDVGQPAYK